MWNEKGRKLHPTSIRRICLGGNIHPVQICCRRKVRGMMARNRHSFSSGAQPTHAQIDPSWRAEKGCVERRITHFSLCLTFKYPVHAQPHFVVHVIYTAEGFKYLTISVTLSKHSRTTILLLFAFHQKQAY